jgi:hypothetical protein
MTEPLLAFTREEYARRLEAGMVLDMHVSAKGSPSGRLSP